MNILQLRDAPASLVWPYQTMRRSLLHLRNGIFVAEGKKTISRLLASNIIIQSMFTTNDFLGFVEAALQKREGNGFPILAGSKLEIEQTANLKFSQGLLAAAQIPDAGQIDAFVAARERCAIVALDSIDHAVNVGGIVRNCAAFGADAICVESSNSHPYLRRAVRTSLGAVFGIPVFAVPLLVDVLQRLAASGFQLIGADPDGEAYLDETPFAKRVCVVFGNEHTGLSHQIRQLPVQRISIRMYQSVDSLNVASASAIFLHAMSTSTALKKG